MANDREVLREIWEGKLPVCFVLNSAEIHSHQTPDPYYLIVPRVSYFPIVCDKVRKHFVSHINPDKQELEMWLDYNGTPLKWHYPIGALFDLYAYDAQLPWSLTVHFDKFPEEEILRCSCREVVESHFMSRLKEADALKHKSQVINGMQKKEHAQMWLGLLNDKFDQFWSVNKKLMEGSEFRSIPFRCYYTDDSPFLQKLVKPKTDDGKDKSLLDFIKEIHPDDYSNYKIIIHGIILPEDAPLQWISQHLSYPDNFLHLCLFPKYER